MYNEIDIIEKLSSENVSKLMRNQLITILDENKNACFVLIVPLIAFLMIPSTNLSENPFIIYLTTDILVHEVETINLITTLFTDLYCFF